MIFMAKSSVPENSLLTFFSEPIYQFIREIGFPIAVSILLFWFIYQSQNFIYKLIETEQMERKELRLILDKQNQTLEKQSEILQRITEKLERKKN